MDAVALGSSVGPAVGDYVLAVYPSSPLIPYAVPNEVLFMQGMFQELWGLFGLFAALLGLLYLGRTVALGGPRRRRPAVPREEADAWRVRHLAVIMDGNRRFGKSKYGVATKGHWDGGQTLADFIDWCMEADVEILTVYAFSTENWNRSTDEINSLMRIFEHFSLKIQRTAEEKGICVRFLSTDPERLPPHIQRLTRTIEEATQSYARFRLNVCLSYGGRGEIANACRQIARRVQAGELTPEDIDEQLVSDHLLTAGLPHPDLLLRTSGENRTSNFLPFQTAYSELVFVKKPWPAMTREDLRDVLDQFTQRDRRFGK
eukprot:EG_transcript_11371